MRFGVLGPLAVSTDAGEPVVVPGVKVRVLLADLLTNRNHVVSADRLIDDLWASDPPVNASGALQVRVSQLRKALNDAEPGARDLIESRPPGYVLRTGPHDVDADRFLVLSEATDAGRLTEALEMWRGDPYADVADAEFVRAEATRLAEQRLAVRERLADARLARGEHDLVAAELAELVARHPLREGLRGLQMRALYAGGRQAEALDAYADLRERLAGELGLDPGPELVALHRQILAQDTGLSAPPAAARVRNNLPARLDELVGRAEAVTEVCGLVRQRRLVTLVGPGGVGKTRLATEVARELDFPDGAHFVELAALEGAAAPAVGGAGDGGGAGVAERVLAGLDVREAGGAAVAVQDRLLAAVRHKDLLLVLDNCEAAGLVARLVREAERVTVLATSRAPLGLAGEVVWEVPPLALPADEHDVDAVRRSAAARLFAVRASAHHRAFHLDDRTAPAVAQLCRRLDGLPLALELAATRVRALGVDGVVQRLDDRFRLLTTQQRDLPERQRTLTAVIGWSWDLLDDDERTALARMAVFRDGCTPDAAEAVCETDLDVLARLVDRSLVTVDDTGPAPRYRLLESVAAFCLERVPDLPETRRRHLSYFTELAERADPELRGPRQKEWLIRLDEETANLRAALETSAAESARLAVALTWYWFLRGRLTEARTALARHGGDPRAAEWLAGYSIFQSGPIDIPREISDKRAAWFVAHALIDRSELARAAELLDEVLQDCDPWTEAAALSSRAKLAHAAADLDALERDGNRSARLFAELGDRWGRLQATDWVGGLAEIRAEYDKAAALHRDGLRWAEELSLWVEVGSKLSWLAWIAVQTRDYAQAHELGARALKLAEESDYPAAAVFAELSVGFAARRDGKLDVASAHLEHLVAVAEREEQPALYLPMVLVELGYAAELGGDPAAALELHKRAFDAAEAMGAPRDMISALEGIASATADPETAARVLGAAADARTRQGLTAGPAERDEIERVARRLRGFEEAMKAGLSPDQARAQAG
jgi:predicted ATPase/DNA-binding SARP family transcriptional activator